VFHAVSQGARRRNVYLIVISLRQVENSAVPARLGLKAAALAWLKPALAFQNLEPSRGRRLWPGSSSALAQAAA
jgi:hypothetical protein